MTKLDLAHLAEGLEIARTALEAAPHGDNCFLHSDGGYYDRCFCGKDSVVAHIDGLLDAEAVEQTDPPQIEEAREIVRRALEAADNGNHAGEQAILRMVGSTDRLREAEGALRPFAKIVPSSFYPEDGSEAEVYTAVIWDGVALQDFTGADIARARAYFTPSPLP